VTAEDFNILPPSPIDRSSKQKINKEILEWNHTIDQMDLTDVYRIIHPNIHTIYILLSSPWNFLQNWSYLRHKASLSAYKKIEIIPCILSDHNALKLDLNNTNNSRKYANNWRLSDTLLNDQWVIEEIREENKGFLEANENETPPTRNNRTKQRQS
jgi:hypothetical protein